MPGFADKLIKGTRTAGAVAATAVAGGIAYSLFGVDRNVPLPPAVAAPRKSFLSPRAGQLSYYVDESGSGVPLLLVHSINAAPSAHEMRPLFELYRGKRPVYALDLPGFGASDRKKRTYTPQLFVDAILDTIRMEIRAQVDVIALSLGCEFAAAAALAAPDWVRSLVLISPTGLGKTIQVPEDLIYGTFSFPVWSQPVFDLLTSHSSIRLFTGQSFVGDPPGDFLDYAYATAHQPGARYAPLYFLSGQLFRQDVRTAVYEQLPCPTLVLYDRDPNVSFERLDDVLVANPRWQAVRVAPSLGLPHWELPRETAVALDAFFPQP